MMKYNVRTNKIECPFCGIDLHPYGGRFSPWARDVEEIFLCIRCGYWVNMQDAITYALNMMGIIRQRAARADRYLAAMYEFNGNGYHINGNGNGNGNGHKKPSIRRRVLKLLVNWLDDGTDEHHV